MFDRILCAIDGSGHSDRALALASDLASLYEARLTLVHVAGADTHVAADLRQFAQHEGLAPAATSPAMPSAGSASEVVAGVVIKERDQTVPREVTSRLGDQLLTQAVQQAQLESEVETMLVHGNPAQEILEAAKACEADAIVVGSRGLGAVKSVLLGSVSKKVSHDAECTCITVR